VAGGGDWERAWKKFGVAEAAITKWDVGVMDSEDDLTSVPAVALSLR